MLGKKIGKLDSLGTVMKKFLIAGAALTALIGTQALAADMALKAPPPAPAPAWNWTGWYIGGTAGYGWTREEVDPNVTSSFCNVGIGGCPEFGPALTSGIPTALKTNANGFIGGGEIGYNYQTGQWVLGIEADFSGSGIKGSNTVGASVIPAGDPNVVNTQTMVDQKLSALGTVRGRLGVTPVNSPLLAYVTGGLAYGRVASDTTISENVSGFCFCGPNPSVTGSDSTWRAGWTAGGGLAVAVAPNWSIKAEYLYYDLGSMTYAVPALVQLNGAGTPFFGATVASTANFRGSIVRAGVDFKFH
jgi:outer membrane immunogenic protein